MQKKDRFVLNLILVVSLLVFFFILLNLNNSSFIDFDKGINSFMDSHHYSPLVFISKIISGIFEPVVFAILFLLIIIHLFYKKRKKEANALAFLTFITFAFLELIKLIVHRARPVNSLVTESTFSFPSGHALMAVVFFGMLLFLFEHHIHKKKTKILLTILDVLLILMIGISRIYLNIHWFSDVIASFALGSSLIVFYMLKINSTNIFKRR
jgi:membrane-associated phospholipid phosphatase